MITGRKPTNLDLPYEYGRKINSNAKVVAITAVAISGILLAINTGDVQDFDQKEAETEMILELSTD